MRLTSHMRGLYAEIYAILYLFLKGYRICQWRYKTKLGEIDVIAEHRGQLVCIEVKNRVSMTGALEAVTPMMRNRISRCARQYISTNKGFVGSTVRFDLIAISGFRLVHLDNAWPDPT